MVGGERAIESDKVKGFNLFLAFKIETGKLSTTDDFLVVMAEFPFGVNLECLHVLKSN